MAREEAEKMSRWFRIYDDVINDPKVLRLPEAMRWHWVAVLCVASKNDGEMPSIDDVALHLRMNKHKAAAVLAGLHNAELLDKTETGFVPHNWNGRQYKSDVSTPRVKRFRERERNVSETPPETEADTEADTEAEKKEAPSLRSGGARNRGARLPEDFSLSDDLIEFAAKHGFAGDPLAGIFHDFKDYWHARAGPQGVKLDWPATWRRWIREEAKRGKPKGNGNGPHRPNSLAIGLARLGEIADSIDRPEPVFEGGATPPRLLSHG